MDWRSHYFYAFPPFSVIANCLQKIEQDQSTGLLLVPLWTTQPSTETPSRPPPPTSSVRQSSVPATQQSSSSPRQTPALNGLQSIRESFQQRAISSKATNIILQSRSTGTQKQYAPYVTKWHDFCSKQKVNSYNPPLNAVLAFLNLVEITCNTRCLIFHRQFYFPAKILPVCGWTPDTDHVRQSYH